MKIKYFVVLLTFLLIACKPGYARTPAQQQLMDVFKRGSLAQSKGHMEDALAYYLKGLALSKKYRFSLGIALAHNKIGDLYFLSGQINNALKHHEKSLDLIGRNKQSRASCTLVNVIGKDYEFLGYYEKSLEYYKKALSISEQLKDIKIRAVTISNIAGAFYFLGQHDKAHRYYQQALSLNRQAGDILNTGRTLNNIGLLYFKSGNPDKALAYFKDALVLKRQLKLPVEIVKVVANIGYVYIEQKNFEMAEKFFQEEKQIQSKMDGQAWPTGLVVLNLAKKKYKAANTLLDNMESRWFDSNVAKMQYHTLKGLSLNGLGRYQESTGNLLKAVSLIENERGKIQEEKTNYFMSGYADSRMQAFQGIVTALSERILAGETHDDRLKDFGSDLASAALYFAESIKGRALLDHMSTSAVTSKQYKIPGHLQTKEENLLNQLKANDLKWFAAYKQGQKYMSLHQTKKKKLNDELDKFISELRKIYPGYAAVYYPKPVLSDEIVLKNDEVLLEFVVSNEALYIIAVRKNKNVKLFKVPVSREELTGKITSFLGQLNRPDNFSIEKAEELFSLLLGPYIKNVKSNENIIIVSDGILGLLPFEVLALNAGKSITDTVYAGDIYNISYYQSATVMTFQRTLPDRISSRTLFALGNPIYNKMDPRTTDKNSFKIGSRASNNGKDQYAFRDLSVVKLSGNTISGTNNTNELFFPPLPETEDEIMSIAKTFNVQVKPPDILIGIKANETYLNRSALGEYKYIHFATHADSSGKMQGTNEPFILLGQVNNNPDDDGFLTLSEVLEKKLSADLIVLSACSTGRGKIMKGEGVASFARAFQHAGAKSVLVSMWEVASMETVEYMKIFYSNLKAGKTKLEALKLARTEIKKQYPDPFYWGVFILHGEGL